MTENEGRRFLVDEARLPSGFPTHRHSAEFWAALGRAVATFGFLEEILGKAIFALTGTRRVSEDKFQEEYEKWLPTLERALSDPLGGLIDSYGKAFRTNEATTVKNMDELLSLLRKASTIRNVLCHGSWRIPDALGRSLPLFVDKNQRIFETPIDIAYLNQVQRHVSELICAVINSVTHMGWKFPGSNGPGIPIDIRAAETDREKK